VSGPATADHIVVTLTYDTENGVTLPAPKKIQLPVTMPLADVFARAASINQSNPPPLSFTSLLVGMMASSPSLTEILGRQGATLTRIGRSRGQTYDESSLNRIGAQLLPTELGATVSARRAIETAGTIAASLKSPALDVRHLAAAYPILSNWHVDDFKEFGIDRLAWCRELGAEMAAKHPDERSYWRGYADRASPVPLTSFSADVYTEKDLLGIDRTVDALALLMASTRTDTPLSIGIFGPWGSGKSFFMRHLRRKIWGLAEREQNRVAAWIEKRGNRTATKDDAPLYYGQVAQVEFNAWHYNEGNLVASLVDHLFRNLRVLPEGKDKELEERRASVLVQISAVEGKVVEAATVIDRTRQQVEQARQDVDRAHGEVIAARQGVDAQARELEATSAEARREREQLDTAIQDLAADTSGIDAGDVVNVALRPLTEAPAFRDAKQAARNFASAVGDWRTFASRLASPRGAAVLALCLAVPLVAWFTNWFTGAWATVSGLGLTGAAGAKELVDYLRERRREFETRLQQLDEEHARRVDAETKELQQEQAKVQASWDKKIAALRGTLEQQRASLAEREAAVESAAKALADRTKELEAKVQDRASAETKLQDLQAQLKRLSSALLLDEFIKERSGTDEYRKQLGFLALVRRDFERLSDLIARANEEWCAPDKNTPAPLLNRIVLYIDDLDRCKVDTVVQVLEAVHLLLAFPLFVCVVAVDPRWIEQCLREKHKDRFSEETENQDRRATVGDYLEKIFQIPIWMREITSEQRAVVVKSLLGATAAPLATTPTIGALSGEAPAAVSPPPRGSEARRLDGFQTALDVAEENPDPLRITPQEASFVESVAPLLSDKPRALKRFVNSYRLLKASLSDLDRQTFVVDGECSPYKICLSQLAYFTGQPRLGPILARELEHVSGDHSTLLDWLDTAKAPSDDATRTSVLAAARLIPDAAAMRLKDFQDWLPETTRYLFHRDD
jgi:KAP-like P-loop domain-containing protein